MQLQHCREEQKEGGENKKGDLKLWLADKVMYLLACCSIASNKKLLNMRHNMLSIGQLLELVQVGGDACRQKLSL